MRILIGVQGTGNGHISRCAALAEALQRYSIDVDYLVSGRERAALFDMQMFGDFAWRQGLTFAVKDGRLALLETLQRNRWRTFWNDVNGLDLSAYDLVVSDFEPVTAWAGRQQQQRVIGIGRQFAFFERLASLPVRASQRQLLRWFAPVSDAVGMHWLADSPNILPPVIHHRAGDPAAVNEQQIIVYLPFEPLAAVHRLLETFSDYQFHIFHPQAERKSVNHLHYYAPSRQEFATVFASSNGVISNAGFETASEALAAGKKLLVRPLAGQFEQMANASCLAEQRLATVMSELDTGVVQNWLQQGRAKKFHWPHVADHIAQWLASGAEQPIHELSQQVWRQCEFEDYYGLLQHG